MSVPLLGRAAESEQHGTLSFLVAAPNGFRAIMIDGVDDSGNAVLEKVQIAAFGLFVFVSSVGRQTTEAVAMFVQGPHLVPVTQFPNCVAVLPPQAKLNDIRKGVNAELRKQRAAFAASLTDETTETEPTDGE